MWIVEASRDLGETWEPRLSEKPHSTRALARESCKHYNKWARDNLHYIRNRVAKYVREKKGATE